MAIETSTDHMGSAWIFYLDDLRARAPWPGARCHVVGMFAAADVFGACQWVAQLRRLEAAG